jgi:hypothetical protein
LSTENEPPTQVADVKLYASPRQHPNRQLTSFRTVATAITIQRGSDDARRLGSSRDEGPPSTGDCPIGLAALLVLIGLGVLIVRLVIGLLDRLIARTAARSTNRRRHA